MDNTADSRAHAASIKNLLKLTGIVDEFDFGDPNTDQEIMNIICGVIKDFDPAKPPPQKKHSRRKTKKETHLSVPQSGDGEDNFFSAQMSHHDTIVKKKLVSPRGGMIAKNTIIGQQKPTNVPIPGLP